MSDSEVIYDSANEEQCSFVDIISEIYDLFEEPHQKCMSQKLFWNHLVQAVEEAQVMEENLEEDFERLKTSLKRMANHLNLKVNQNCQQSFTDSMILVKEAKGSYYKTLYSVELKNELKKCLTSLLPVWIVSHETCCLSLATIPTSTSSMTAATPVIVADVSGEKKSAKRKILNFEDDCTDSDEDSSKHSHLPTGLISSYISVQKDGSSKQRILTER